MKQLLTLTLLLLAFTSFGQERELYNSSQQKRLQSLSSELSTVQDNNYQKAVKIATEKKWQLSGTLKNNRFFKLYGIDETGHPLYLATESNAQAAATTRTDQLYSGGSLGLSLNGSGASVKNKLGIWDGGGVLSTHQELTSRVTQQDRTTGTNIHATHVAGTLIAKGVSPLARGMSFGASLKAWDFTSDNSEMTAAATELLVSNHSYGFLAGWSYDENRSRWSWYGNTSISQTEDYKFGFYDSNTQSWDKIANSAPYYLIVKSAGNNRDETGPSAGEYYYLGTSSDTSSVARSKNDSYDILATTSTAKNILTVGAVSGTNGKAPQQSSDIKISSFSSWGPTDDGRIKPDIVAVGVNVLSSSNASNSSYTIYSGTSMSSPQAAGSILLLQELYAQKNDGLLMRSSTLKGLVLHTADDAGNAGPDYIYGWGLLNMEKAAKVILNADKSYDISERTLANGATFTQKVTASGKGALTATICWTDPEGTITTASVANLNNRTPKLINDLDIRISDGTNTSLPFILNPDQPSAVATRGDNIRDNVEQILIPNAIPGKSYTITVSHKSTLKNNTQDYALILSGIGGTEYCASTPTTIQNNIESVKLGDLTADYKIASSQSIPLEISLKGTTTKKVNVYVDWNANGTFEETTELATSSEQLVGVTTFKSTISAPSGLTIGNSTLIRVIVAENSGTANISSCGTYVQGVTQDYKIEFVRPSIDIAVVDLIKPEINTFCASSSGTVSVSLRNTGTTAQQNIPVTVNVLDGASMVATLTETYKNQLSTFSEGTLVLDGSFTAKVGASYTFEVKVNLSTDQDITNNSKSFVRQVTASNAPTTAQATVCEGATALNVKGTETSTLLWYDAQTGGNLLFTGNTGTFNKPTTASKIYVGVNDISGSVGAKDKYVFGGGTYYETFGPEPIIVTQTPLVIESARVYIGTAGKITFTIYRQSDSTPISSVTLDVTPTRTTANSTRSSNQLIDDLTDQGIVLPLNLSIPAAGTYILSQECTDGASIYRTNLNANSTVSGADITGYPFTIPNVISITGAVFNGSTIKTGYYYLYDMKVKSYGCPSNRVEVPITTQAAPKVTISPSSSFSICQDDSKLLTASTGTNYTYQWLLNGQTITGATSATYAVEKTGNYSVKVTENGFCSATSTAISGTVITPVIPAVKLDGTTLSLSSGSNPVWYLSGNIITDATTNTIVPLQTGVYMAKVTDVNGCSVFSEGYTFTVTATDEEINSVETARIYPNPASESFKVEYNTPNNPKYVYAEMINIMGITVSSKELIKNDGKYSAEFDVSKQNSGTFFLRIITDNSLKVIPIVVNRN